MSMQKGVHYDESFSATPKIETCRLMVVLRVLLRLASRCFDVSHAYAWAGRSKMIALRYPRVMDQYRDGEEVYMSRFWVEKGARKHWKKMSFF